MSNNDVADAIKEVAENEVNVISVAKMMLKGGKENVQVSLEHKKVMPERMESQARCHVFHDAEGFMAFLSANKTKHTFVFADVNGVVIYAVLDDKAKTGFETVSLRPPYHPEFSLLNDALLNKSLPIAFFAQGIMRNRKVIQDSPPNWDAKSLALAMQQLTVASAIVQAIGDGKTAVNGVMTTTTVMTGSPEAKEHLDLPETIKVKVPIYLNTEAVEFDIDITVSSKSGAVFAITDAPELEVKKYEVFETMLKDVKALEGVTVVYGWPSRADWKYNK